jgi:nucleolin
VGRRVPEVDEGGVPILYPRYTRVDELLLANGGAKASADHRRHNVAAPSGSGSSSSGEEGASSDSEDEAPATKQTTKEQKKEKKDKKKKNKAGEQEEAEEEQQQQTDDHAEEGDDDAAHQSKRARVGNADEARHLRNVFGFDTSDGGASASASAAAAAKAAAAAAAAAAATAAANNNNNGGGKFAFGFDAQVAAQVEAETDLKLARLKALDAADKDGYVPRRVFVGGMPYSYTREQVHEYWSWCGEVRELDVLTFPDTGRFRGIAFVTFADDAGYEAALACDGEALDGQTLKVEKCKAAAAVARRNFSVGNAAAAAAEAGHQASHEDYAHNQQQQQQQQQAQQQHAGAPAKAPGYNVAYVGNVAFEATREELAGVFGACGVKLVRLHTDQATGRSKGYAHVHFEDEAGLDRALALNGHVLRGRALRVSYGQPKKA